LREGGRDVVDEGLEYIFLVVADDENFLDIRNVGDRAEAVFNDWVAGDREERLFRGLAGVNCISDIDMQLTLGSSIDSGLNLVPLDGPPT
jgi:hypothetical protein